MNLSWLYNSETVDAAYVPDLQATVFMPSISAPSAFQPAAPKIRDYTKLANDVRPWGDGNDFPQQIIELYSRDPIIPETFSKKVSMINMSDVIAVELQGYNDDQSEILKWIDDDEIWQFLNNQSTKRYLLEASLDLVWFFNAFPELIMTRNREKVLYISHQEAANCRYEYKPSQAEVEWVHLNANWPWVGQNDPLTLKRRCLDPYRWDRVEWARGLKDGSFIYPINIPSPGKDFYQLANHDSIRTSGWLDIHLSVPQFKKSMMHNEIAVKFHLKVDPKYWGMLYGEDKWKAMEPKEKKAKKEEWLKSMNSVLTDVQNAGKSIMTERVWDQVNAKYLDYIEITTVTEGMREGKYIQDGLEAAANIFYAAGIDPTIVGFAGGEKLGQKSGGSDKREAWLIQTHMLKPYRDPLLEPLYFAAEFNGWTKKYPRLKFRHRDVILTTLDTGAGTKKTLS